MTPAQLAPLDLAVIGMAGVLICYAVWEALLGKGKRK